MLIFDQEVYFRVRKFYGLVFFRVRSFLAFPTVIPYPFYPEVPPEGLWVASQHSKPLGHAGFLKSVRENFRADTHVVAYIGNRNSFRDTNELIGSATLACVLRSKYHEKCAKKQSQM